MMLEFNIDCLPPISQGHSLGSNGADMRNSLLLNSSGPDSVGANLVEPDTTGLPYEAACRERAKFFLSETLLPFGIPDPQVSIFSTRIFPPSSFLFDTRSICDVYGS